MRLSILWFRNDLRLENHPGIQELIEDGIPIVALFIFDKDILDDLPEDDARVNIIYDQLQKMHIQLQKLGSSMLIKKGEVTQVWEELLEDFEIQKVYMAEDFEPSSIARDEEIKSMLLSKGIEISTNCNQVIIHPTEVLKKDGKPYSVYTPYSKKWKNWVEEKNTADEKVSYSKLKSAYFHNYDIPFPSLESLGFRPTKTTLAPLDLSPKFLSQYEQTRDTPSLSTSHLSTYLRFGFVDIHEVYQKCQSSEVFIRELIWREFFKQILYHYPKVVDAPFKAKYQDLPWLHDTEVFEKWATGMTGYPLVDAGMRELNQTGLMHNRVRMVTASFLVKHLLIDWQWGEAYFAEKLLDYDLSANNGNWQWVVGCGCDAAPYFRVFNPTRQMERYDPQKEYIRKWVPEWETESYPEPIVDHGEARVRALAFYKKNMRED